MRDYDTALASYFVHWTVGQPRDTHPANIDLIYGAWGPDSSQADRCAVSLVHFENDQGPGIAVIDAHQRPIARSDLVGRITSRDDVIGTDLAQRVFAIVDAVLLQDKRLP